MTGFNGENDDDTPWELWVPYFQTKPFVLGILSASPFFLAICLKDHFASGFFFAGHSETSDRKNNKQYHLSMIF